MFSNESGSLTNQQASLKRRSLVLKIASGVFAFNAVGIFLVLLSMMGMIELLGASFLFPFILAIGFLVLGTWWCWKKAKQVDSKIAQL